MLKKLYALKNKKGFTLVELMVVVAIMGILVAVAVPVYNNVTRKAAIQTCATNCRTIESAISQMKTIDEVDGDILASTTKLTGAYVVKAKSTEPLSKYLKEIPADADYNVDIKGTVTASNLTKVTGITVNSAGEVTP